MTELRALSILQVSRLSSHTDFFFFLIAERKTGQKLGH